LIIAFEPYRAPDFSQVIAMEGKYIVNMTISLVGGVCGGILILALGIAGIVLVITGARARKRSGGSPVGLIIGIVCLVLSACIACSLLAYWAMVVPVR
jgi:hypothetical protein